MDCRTARLLLDFARPRCPELPPGDADALDAHLSGCAECDLLARGERAADARLAQATCAVPLPEGLHARILLRLKAERGDVNRRRLGWAVRVAAAAAVVFLGVWGGFAWFGGRTRELDLGALHDKEFIRWTSPSRQKVEDWFKEDFNLTTVAPSGFNYAFLKDFGLASCQGQRVPSMFFARDGTEAHVYVISRDQFDVKALNEAELIDSGGYRLEVKSPDPEHAFVVIYKGDSLQPLLTDDGSAQ